MLTIFFHVFVFAFKVLHFDKVADIQIPVEPFKNENESKIGIATYDSDKHLKVQITPIYDVFIVLLSVIAIRKLVIVTHFS